MKTTIELNKGRLRGGRGKTFTTEESKANKKARAKRRYAAATSRTVLF